jgi:hypothetical protein
MPQKFAPRMTYGKQLIAVYLQSIGKRAHNGLGRSTLISGYPLTMMVATRFFV